jgi:carboxylesterase type B
LADQQTALVEGSVFVLPKYKFPPTPANYSDFLVTNFGHHAQLINKTYPISKFSKLPYPIYSAMVVIATDYPYICRAYRAMATATRRGIPAYAYIWGQEPTCPWYSAIGTNKEVLQLLGATHTAELPYVFNNTNNLPGPDGNCSLNGFEKQIAGDIVEAYTSMAETRAPDKFGSFNWPAFSNSKPFNSTGLVVGNGTVKVGPIDFSACKFWDAVDDEIFAEWTKTST